MNNKGIRSSVFHYVEQNPGSKRAEIMAALNLDGVQASNALGYWREVGRLFPSGIGRFTTWTAVKPEVRQAGRDPLMAIFGR